jgi:hypothetical protein
MRALVSEMRHDAFDEWLDEIEVFSARWERLYSDFPTLDENERKRLLIWLRAAYEVGIEAEER